MTLFTHLNNQLIGSLIEDEKIIADENIIDLLQVNNFLYSWFVKKKIRIGKKIYIERIRFFFTLPLFFYRFFYTFCISLYLFG